MFRTSASLDTYHLFKILVFNVDSSKDGNDPSSFITGWDFLTNLATTSF
jgi:hypothetical protein